MDPILELQDYFLTDLHLDFRIPEADEEAVKAVRLEFDYETMTRKDAALHRLLLLKVKAWQVNHEEEPIGYELSCTINGHFIVPADLPSSQQEGLLRLNGLSILYSTLRGIVGNISGSFPGGRLCLPTILPREEVDRIEANRAKQFGSQDSGVVEEPKAKPTARKATKKKSVKAKSSPTA